MLVSTHRFPAWKGGRDEIGKIRNHSKVPSPGAVSKLRVSWPGQASRAPSSLTPRLTQAFRGRGDSLLAAGTPTMHADARCMYMHAWAARCAARVPGSSRERTRKHMPDEANRPKSCKGSGNLGAHESTLRFGRSPATQPRTTRCVAWKARWKSSSGLPFQGLEDSAAQASRPSGRLGDSAGQEHASAH